MARGGPRPGAGRKKGSVNRIDDEARTKAAAEGIMPLDYMLSVLRDEGLDRATRMDAAKAAAPYVHAKLSTTEHTGKGGGPIDMSLTVEFIGTDNEGATP